ncbi:MAG: esterase-like activity of phytase family protein [Calothrix sp. C42_A2020_038]|nr:esterase-like activity of phytase family protein [Calothrix sp. C42_A2020_038]
MLRFFFALALISLLIGSQSKVTELTGRAILLADTFAPGYTSGQFKKTNRTTPFVNTQPVQGFSAVEFGPKPGTFYVISDNGFGAKTNSWDYILRVYAVEPDFSTGKVYPVDFQTGERIAWFSRRSFIELNDRNLQANFSIIAEQINYPGSNIAVSPLIKANRLLTGGDFDPESFRRNSDGTFWVGDEFGPFLLHFGQAGELLEPPIPLPNFLRIGQLDIVRSPDNPDLASLEDDKRTTLINLGGSKGFEGLAINPSRTKLYAMLEGALKDDTQKDRLLIHEFDLASQKYTGQVFAYQLENPSYAIGEMTAINESEYIVIERDNNQGDPNNPAFESPATFKRLYKINLEKVNKAGFVEKELLVDLLNISDPKSIGTNATKNGVFTFPFVTIESVLPLNAKMLLVINDNNYADSIGRIPKQPDHNEFIQISLKQPLSFD